MSLESRTNEYLPNVELTLMRLALLTVVFSGGGRAGQFTIWLCFDISRRTFLISVYFIKLSKTSSELTENIKLLALSVICLKIRKNDESS